MRRSGCSGGKVLGTAVSVLAKHFCGRWQQKGPGVHGPRGGLHPRLGSAKRWGAGVFAREPQEDKIGIS